MSGTLLICRSDYPDDHPFNSLQNMPDKWRRERHYCSLPLRALTGEFWLYPAGSASEAWAEWRATGLVRVVVVHYLSNCKWSLGSI